MKDLDKDTAGSAALAIFDLDGTIMSTNVIEQYFWARLPELSRTRQLAEVGKVMRRLPSYLRAEQRDRGTFLRAVYRRYRGADLAALERFVDTSMAPHILSRLSPEAVRRIREHRAAGHTTILITGVVRPLTRPIQPLFDVIVAAELGVDFQAHPFEGGPRGAARLPQWTFPGASSIERLLSTSERAHKLAERVVTRAPRSDRTRKIAKDLDRTRIRLDFLRRYHTLYKEYAQSELHFVDDNTLALTRALHPDDQAAFAFDTSVFDWKTYIQEVHCPSITAPVRRMDAARSKRGNRPTTMKDLDKDTAGSAALAIFDLDGTIMSTNVIEQYLWARLPELSLTGQLAEVGQVMRRLPSYLRAEQRDRGTFLRAVYRRYRGADLAALEHFVDTSMAPHILSRLSPEAVRRIREHRAAGHKTILITGVVRSLTRPIQPLFDVIVAAELGIDERGPLHRLSHRAAAGRGVPSGVAQALRGAA